jgi:hypothetical protein
MRLPGQDVGRHVKTDAKMDVKTDDVKTEHVETGHVETESETTDNGGGPDPGAGNERTYPPPNPPPNPQQPRRHQQYQWQLRAAGHHIDPVPHRPSPACVAGLASYREAVAEMLYDVAGHLRSDDLRKTETILAERLDTPEITPMLAVTPGGAAAAIGELLAEVRNYQPSVRRSASYAADLTAMIRVYLLARVDVMWWGKARPYATDTELAGSSELIDLEALRQSGMLRFQYRLQVDRLLARATRAADRRLRPDRLPRTAGLRSAYVRPEVVALLNQLSTRFAEMSPPGTPPLWITSLARSVEHQRRLRALGYKATLPSSHCVGFATDIEMSWFRRFGAHRVLARLLLERQNAGELNVIDEGQVWHVCLNPAAAAGLRRAFDAETGG